MKNNTIVREHNVNVLQNEFPCRCHHVALVYRRGRQTIQRIKHDKLGAVKDILSYDVYFSRERERERESDQEQVI